MLNGTTIKKLHLGAKSIMLLVDDTVNGQIVLNALVYAIGETDYSMNVDAVLIADNSALNDIVEGCRDKTIIVFSDRLNTKQLGRIHYISSDMVAVTPNTALKVHAGEDYVVDIVISDTPLVTLLDILFEEEFSHIVYMIDSDMRFTRVTDYGYYFIQGVPYVLDMTKGDTQLERARALFKDPYTVIAAGKAIEWARETSVTN